MSLTGTLASEGRYLSSSEGIVPKDGVGTDGGLGAFQEPKAGRSKKTKPIWILIGVTLAVLATAGAVVGILFAKHIIKTHSRTADTAADSASGNNSGDGTGGASSGSNAGSGSHPIYSNASASAPASNSPAPTACSTPDSIPAQFKGTNLDPTSWLDLTGFNCTFTDETVGDLPIVGLNMTWDDSKQANPTVPTINKPWGAYNQKPIRGVNLGGWLSLEPFITPSLFDYPSSLGIIDEYTLCAHLGLKDASAVLEKHYSTFITEDDFKSIADAGLDHVRIPYSYWAVTTYDGDPYPPGLSWRYLLRGIEWARKYGLRVKLDLHGLPGSQNGWNHSGRQGTIGWLMGVNGTINGQRSLDIHNQLSKFFSQDRYKNVLAFYGLANEPGLAIPLDPLVTWTAAAYKIVHDNGVTAIQVFSEAIRGLGAWAGELPGYGDSLVIDVHEYTIFVAGLLQIKHTDRISFACNTFTAQITASMDKSAGYGPTMVGEWSQADTDCVEYLNAVGNGARWDGTFSGNLGSPACPTLDSSCNCKLANADPSTFTPQYKSFLQTWGEAQMSAFEDGWGWFYWTWKTESAPLWSYQAGLKGNFMPPLAYERSWNCSVAVPSFDPLPEYY